MWQEVHHEKVICLSDIETSENALNSTKSIKKANIMHA